MSLEQLKYACIQTFVNSALYVRRSQWFSPATQPDSFRTYARRRDLYPSRVFIPRTHNGQQRLPLIVCVHGGGFIVNNPALDDPLARHLADSANSIVVSIDYRKAPQHRFPAAYEDVVELSLAAIEDPDLALDRSRVVLCGSSAGGNLVLAAAQHPRLRPKLTGVVSLYPVVDFVPDCEAKMATRPDPAVPDFLGDGYAGVIGLYVGKDRDVSTTDVRLSPSYFAKREDLPPNMLLLGCEHDLLCREAEDMADKLVAAGGSETKVETEAGWQAGGVRWHKVAGQTHAFDNFAAKTAEGEKVRLKARDETYSMLSEWMTRVFEKENA